MAVPLLVAALLALSGCAASTGPDVITVSAAQYAEAFDLSAEVARRRGLIPDYRDRRTGVLETHPAIAGSLFEPWNRLTLSIEQAAESTFRFQRRRARFEFIPAEMMPSETTADRRDVLPLELTEIDLTQIEEGDLELRVWVYVEESSRPDLRRDSWSRRLTTRSPIVRSDPDDASTQQAWIPVARDRILERHLLGEVQRRLTSGNVGNDVDEDAG
ncbi:MAG: hypothetical protein EA377_01475 [Phycisphaerales bacterium]|nr:MAG: hypothetical protein EA377_01475 [Phycisphaerales bacterium]